MSHCFYSRGQLLFYTCKAQWDRLPCNVSKIKSNLSVLTHYSENTLIVVYMCATYWYSFLF